MSLADILSEGGFRFQLGLERGSLAEFYGPTTGRDSILGERRRWLATPSRVYADLLPQGEPLLEETIALARSLSNPGPPFSTSDPSEWLRQLGMWWEPDFLLLKADSEGRIRLWGGCVCFPSSWALSDKMGEPLGIIHGVVPGLNREIGPRIHQFLTRLKPGSAWFRSNWGLCRSSDLNQHPERKLPRLDRNVRPEEVWFRVEHQALAALPESGGILFGIRVVLHPFSSVLSEPLAAERLAQALRTMPDEVAEYKGLKAARGKLLELLRL